MAKVKKRTTKHMLGGSMNTAATSPTAKARCPPLKTMNLIDVLGKDLFDDRESSQSEKYSGTDFEHVGPVPIIGDIPFFNVVVHDSFSLFWVVNHRGEFRSSPDNEAEKREHRKAFFDLFDGGKRGFVIHI